MKTKISILISITAILLCAFLTTASADVAPPLQPPGANPGLPEFAETNVKMAYEEVDIVVSGVSDLYYSEMGAGAVNASISARFQMINQGESPETHKALFPLNNTQGWGDGFLNHPEVQNLSISIDGNPVGWAEITSANPFDTDDPPVKWAQFEVVFHPRISVWIEITYDIQSTGYLPEATFFYILETGSGWSGPIEEGHITLTLPYEASQQNVFFGDHNMLPFQEKTSSGARFNGNTVTWDFYDLEPQAEDNWAVTIIDPLTWQEVITLRERIEDGDAFAYSELTRVYDDILINHSIRGGTEELIDLSTTAYIQAIELEPKNDEVLARFANFQIFLYEHGHETPYGPFSIGDIYQTAQQALDLNPTNETAESVADWIEQSYNYTPPALSTVDEQQADSGNQGTEAGPADGAVSVEDLQEDPNQDIKNQNNAITYLLGAGFLAAVGMILALVFKPGKKNAS